MTGEKETTSHSAGIFAMFGASERRARAARTRWLPEGRRGPMPWIIAIMMFLTLLAAAAGLGLAHGLMQMRGQLAGGYTIQLVEADAQKKAAQLAKIETLLGQEAGVQDYAVVSPEKLQEQLEPWIGSDMAGTDIPIPALIDVELKPGQGSAAVAALSTAIRRVAPSARMDAHERYLAPVERMMRALMWLAAALVVLMILVTGAVVMLAAKSAHDTHRPTIDIMHLLGATDVQIARLFQRRMALDAIFGGALGLATAAAVLALLGRGIASMESEFVRMLALPWHYWAIFALIPVLGVMLAVLTARITVRRALERSL
tara:strand:- start:93256 stop:94203 length:948 start_codon:yes stop_codon:yes gene_type:complete